MDKDAPNPFPSLSFSEVQGSPHAQESHKNMNSATHPLDEQPDNCELNTAICRDSTQNLSKDRVPKIITPGAADFA